MTPPHIPTATEALEPGRTDIYIGELLVGWIEWFPAVSAAEVNIEVADPVITTRHLLHTGGAVECLDAVRAYLPKSNRPTLKIRHRSGTERSWAAAHKETT